MWKVPLIVAVLVITFFCTFAAASSWEACQVAVASSSVFDVTQFGAIGDASTMNTKAIQAAIHAAGEKASAGNVPTFVYVPEGVFVTGSINLTTLVYLCLDDGAEIRGSDFAQDYAAVDSITSDTGPFDFPLICLWEIHHSGLLASSTSSRRGRVNGGLNSPPGNHILRYDPAVNFLYPEEWNLPGCTHFSCRPKLVVARLSSDLVFEGVGLVNSNLWTLTLSESKRIVVDGAEITGERNFPNNDGIDCISCMDLVVTNTRISTGDDCVAIITHSADTLTNVTLTNLNLQSSSAAIKVASFEGHATGGVKGVMVRNVSITDTNRGICIGARWGTGRISDLSFSEMQIETHYFGPMFWGAAEPIQITSCWASQEHKWLGSISNITFDKVTMHGENGIFVYSNVTGEKLAPIVGLKFSHCSLLIDRFSNISAPMHDWRPSLEPQIENSTISAIYIDGATDVVVEDSKWSFATPSQPFYSKCVTLMPGSTMKESHVSCVPPRHQEEER